MRAAGHAPFPDLDVVRAPRLVDENDYLINAAGVHDANADPADHYCRFGWREHRKTGMAGPRPPRRRSVFRSAGIRPPSSEPAKP
jgi:hypothetical protein